MKRNKELKELNIPASIKTAHNKLVELCERNPVNIKLEEVAEFLGMDKEGLRSSIDQGRCPFGLCVQKHKYANRAFKISTYVFFNWATNNAICQTLTVEKLNEGKPRKFKRRA